MAPPDDGFIGWTAGRNTFYQTITAAVADITENGFDSQERITMWMDRIRRAAIESMTPEHVLRAALNDTLQTAYRRLVERGGVLRYHPGVSRFTLAKVKPRLRAELDRRIMASAGLIKLNRAAAIEKTLQRFAGWATSIPAGGSDAVEKNPVKTDIRKALVQLPYAERRVAVDQGHKLASNLNNILATDGGAIAVRWNSHYRQANYNFRREHKERDGHVYMLRGNWAQDEGLVKAGPDGYYEDVTAFGEEVFCRCFGTYLYSLRALPTDMLTVKGRAELQRVKIAA